MDLSRITNRRTDLTCLACEQSEPSCANVVSALCVARLRCVSYVEDVVALVLRLFLSRGATLMSVPTRDSTDLYTDDCHPELCARGITE